MRASLPFFFIALFSAAVAARAATNVATTPAPYRDFESACRSVFEQTGGAASPAGKQICECASEESKHQGVTVAELEKETAEIRKNPKYKIQNKKLLASFHYCVILAMDDQAHSGESDAPDTDH